MKDRSGTELCCLLGPDGGTGIFGGKKAAPFFGGVGSIALMPKKRPRRRKSSILQILDITGKEVERKGIDLHTKDFDWDILFCA